LRGAYVTSPVKCAPPANKPTTDERDRCAPFLAREIELIDPSVYVALGGFGWDAVCRHVGWEGRKPKFGHGAETILADGRTLLGSYHVSQQNTFTGRLTEEMLDAVFLRAKQILVNSKL
jgi:uracil-DNA glycosylase